MCVNTQGWKHSDKLMKPRKVRRKRVVREEELGERCEWRNNRSAPAGLGSWGKMLASFLKLQWGMRT